MMTDAYIHQSDPLPVHLTGHIYPPRVFGASVRNPLNRWGASGQLTAKDAQLGARQQYQQSSRAPRCGSSPAAGPVEDRAKRCPPRSGLCTPDL
ncbi:hypothetical protein NDU88_008233 [Pleurodeles waltl]|uniref:Uncharacterized protein n=1 Tax=Pleurodeles waltl TaxID=8319 RepID=A0AAV7VRY4_PLEWA|nr:hypothetical protein NDU88_008233 [Pleurodeles waltl]